MCGGAIELLPCSHVGHIYKYPTYSFNGDKMKIEATNIIRMVEVWMDEFKHLFYAANPRNFSHSKITKIFINFYYFDFQFSYFNITNIAW